MYLCPLARQVWAIVEFGVIFSLKPVDVLSLLEGCRVLFYGNKLIWSFCSDVLGNLEQYEQSNA